MKKFCYSLLAVAFVMFSFVACSEDDGKVAGDAPTYEYTEPDVYADSVALDVWRLALEIGQTYQLNATVFPDTVTNPAIRWTVDRGSNNDVTFVPSSVASVDSTGLVTALNIGVVDIRAASETKLGVWDACYLEVVNNLYAEDIIMVWQGQEISDGATITLYDGEADTIKLKVEPWYANTLDVAWNTTNAYAVAVTPSPYVLDDGTFREVEVGAIQANGAPGNSAKITMGSTYEATSHISKQITVEIIEYPMSKPVISDRYTAGTYNSILVEWTKAEDLELVAEYHFYIDGYDEPIVVEAADRIQGTYIGVIAQTTDCAVLDLTELENYDGDFDSKSVNVTMKFVNNRKSESETSNAFSVNILGNQYIESLTSATIEDGDEISPVYTGMYTAKFIAPNDYCTSIDITAGANDTSSNTVTSGSASVTFYASAGTLYYDTVYEFGFRSIYAIDRVYTEAHEEAGTIPEGKVVGDYRYVQVVTVDGGTATLL